MAGATWYGNVSGAWSSSATWGSADDGLGGDGTPGDDDIIVIAAGVSVWMDTDTSGYTTGLRNVTIRGHATTPGMLYFKDGASGFLKIASGYSIQGTSSVAVYGRLLANSNGTWGTTTPMSSSYTATMQFAGTGSKIVASYLDIALYATEPTKRYLRTYGTKYDFTASGSTVDTSANTIDLGTTPPSAGTPVMITTSGGTLPAPLLENYIYYVRAVSGNTCKLATRDSDTCVVNLTSTGSGTCTLYQGFASGSTTINVLDDVTGDAAWTTTSGWNRVALVDTDCTTTPDVQRTTLSTINAGSVVVADAVDSAQWPGYLVLVSRNVAIRYTGNSTVSVVDFGTSTTSGVLNCEISCTYGGTGSYGTGINSAGGSGSQTVTVGGSVYGFNQAISGTTSANSCVFSVSGVLVSCTTGISSTFGAVVTSTGLIVGCPTGCSTTRDIEMSGRIWTASTGISGSYYGEVAGEVAFCYQQAVSGPRGMLLSGDLRCSGAGLNGGSWSIFSGVISGCGSGTTGFGGTVTAAGAIYGCSTGLAGGTVAVPTIYYGALGTAADGTSIAANLTDISFSSEPVVLFRGGALISTPPTFSNQNNTVIGNGGYVAFEDYGRTLGASRIYWNFGTIIKQASVVRSGGAASALECTPLSNCSVFNHLPLFEWTEAAVPASSQTRTVYMRGFGWSSWPSNTELYIEAEYISNGTTFATTTTKSTATLTDNTTWTAFSVTFTPAVAGNVRYRGYLKKYAANSGVYVDAQLN